MYFYKSSKFVNTSCDIDKNDRTKHLEQNTENGDDRQPLRGIQEQIPSNSAICLWKIYIVPDTQRQRGKSRKIKRNRDKQRQTVRLVIKTIHSKSSTKPTLKTDCSQKWAICFEGLHKSTSRAVDQRQFQSWVYLHLISPHCLPRTWYTNTYVGTCQLIYPASCASCYLFFLLSLSVSPFSKSYTHATGRNTCKVCCTENKQLPCYKRRSQKIELLEVFDKLSDRALIVEKMRAIKIFESYR